MTKMANLVIRSASLSDTYALSSCSARNLPIHYGLAQSFIAISDDKSVVFLAEDSGSVVGFIIAELRTDKCHIMSFGVDKEYRGHKIGTKLMNAVAEHVKETLPKLTLFVHIENEVGIRFYQKYGFKIVNIVKGYYNGSVKGSQDAIAMSMRL